MSPVITLARTAVVRSIRHQFGRRFINLTPDMMGFGNHLYLWVWAHNHRDDAVAPKVLMTERMRPWAELVPAFAEQFLIEPEDVGKLDQRGSPWAYPGSHSADPRGFLDAERTEFIKEWLLPAPLLDGVESTPFVDPKCLVVNIRRGDYYSPEHRGEHGFDVESYVRLAVERSFDRDGPVERIHLISDELDWCRRRLDWLAAFARVTAAEPYDTPARHFRDLSSARRLIITNSTFSLWAAAVSNVVHGDNHAQIWIPAFFQSSYGPGRCYEYDQSWSVVSELPHGWQPAWVLEGREHA